MIGIFHVSYDRNIPYIYLRCVNDRNIPWKRRCFQRVHMPTPEPDTDTAYISHIANLHSLSLSLAHTHMICMHLHIQAGLTPTRPTTTARAVGLLPHKQALADVVELGRLWSGATLGLHARTEAHVRARTHGARTDEKKQKKKKCQPGLVDRGRCDSSLAPVRCVCMHACIHTYIHTYIHT